jgi:hypothetical protein
MGVGDYPGSPRPGPKHWVLTFPHTPDNVYVEVGQEPDTATGDQGMSEREGSRVTLWFPEVTRQSVQLLAKWLDDNYPKGPEMRTKGKRSWWTESETVRWAVGQAIDQHVGKES